MNGPEQDNGAPPAQCAGGRAAVFGGAEAERGDGNFCWKSIAFLMNGSYTFSYIEKEGSP